MAPKQTHEPQDDKQAASHAQAEVASKMALLNDVQATIACARNMITHSIEQKRHDVHSRAAGEMQTRRVDMMTRSPAGEQDEAGDTPQAKILLGLDTTDLVFSPSDEASQLHAKLMELDQIRQIIEQQTARLAEQLKSPQLNKQDEDRRDNPVCPRLDYHHMPMRFGLI